MSTPFKVLGMYHPNVWSARRIGKELVEFSKNQGFVPHQDSVHGPITTASWCNVFQHAEVRRTTSYGKGGDDWHQDGDTTPGSRMNCGMILWSNTTPTQFKVGETIYQPKPFEVVFAENKGSFHRRDPSAPARRWLFRQRVKI